MFKWEKCCKGNVLVPGVADRSSTACRRILRLVVAGSFVTAIVGPGASNAARVELGDSVTAGVKTTVEHQGRPFGYRVTWIEWDSYFRDSDLRLGDRILGVDDERYTRDDFKRHHAIGDFLEAGYWEARGAVDGHAVVLLVYRDGKPITVPGRLRAERFYFDDEDGRIMGEGGPLRRMPERDQDGKRLFDSTWSTWYEARTSGLPDSFPYWLDGGWERTSFNNGKALARHLQDLERVEYLNPVYPSRFSDSVRHDWKRVRDYLEGDVVEVSEEALDYRTRAERLQTQIGTITRTTIEAYETELGGGLVVSLSVSRGGLAEQRAQFVGKIARFDRLTPRNIVNDLGKTFMVAGSDRGGYFFLRAASAAMNRAFGVLGRYRALVNPRLAERYSVYLEVRDEPMYMSFRGGTVIGLLGEVKGVATGDADVFVDARPLDGELSFAGERETRVEAPCANNNRSAPAQTVECMVEAIKIGDQQTWRSLFATWRFMSLGDGTKPIYHDDYRVRAAIFERAWEHSRRSILGHVYDARVRRVEPARTLSAGSDEDGLPKVEATTVILDHIGLIEGEYRTFVDVTVRHTWRLVRRDGGPWEIEDVRSL